MAMREGVFIAATEVCGWWWKNPRRPWTAGPRLDENLPAEFLPSGPCRRGRGCGHVLHVVDEVLDRGRRHLADRQHAPAAAPHGLRVDRPRARRGLARGSGPRRFD